MSEPESTEARLRRQMEGEVPAGMMAHMDRVVVLTASLARKYGLDVSLARLMAQGHDVARAVPGAELLARAEARGLPIDLAEHFGVTDPRVLFAVRWHTTGHPDYTPEAWAMFVADKVEPRKVEDWPPLHEVLALAEESLERAALRYLDLRLVEAVERGYQVHPLATLARNYLLRQHG